MGDQLAHYNVANPVGGFKRRQVGGVGSHTLAGQALGGSESARLAVKVADRAQHQDALQIHATGVCQKFKRLQVSLYLPLPSSQTRPCRW